jgi:phosphate transport system protein
MHHFEQELAAFQQRLVLMASHAEAALRRAVRALLDRDDALAQRVRDDDNILDAFEVELDDLALRLLTQAPLAADLRLVTVAMKISQNLERVGDEATKIAKRAQDLIAEPPLRITVDLPGLADLAGTLLRESLDAFVRGDAARARTLVGQDKEVDRLHRQILTELELAMTQEPARIKRCLHLMVVTRSLERITDHAKNVAEETVFLREATDIRHLAQRLPEPNPTPGHERPVPAP